MSDLTIHWPGLAGRMHAFETYPIGTTFKEIAGVYIFCKLAANGKWDPIYVGETDNFNQRLNTGLQGHQTWSAARARGATHLSVKIVSGLLGRQARLDLETELRHSLNPPCNRQAA